MEQTIIDEEQNALLAALKAQIDQLEDQLNPIEPEKVAEDCGVCNPNKNCTQCGNPIGEDGFALKDEDGNRVVNLLPLEDE